jgi:hypothetical protein
MNSFLRVLILVALPFFFGDKTAHRNPRLLKTRNSLFLPADAGSVNAHGDIVGGKFALDTTNGPNAGNDLRAIATLALSSLTPR